jgi:hypothetical protein
LGIVSLFFGVSVTSDVMEIRRIESMRAMFTDNKRRGIQEWDLPWNQWHKSEAQAQGLVLPPLGAMVRI